MRKQILTWLIIAVSAIIGFAPDNAGAVDLTHSFVVGGDLGFDLDPDLVAWDFVGEYQVTGNVAMGPLLIFGADKDMFLFGASGMAKYKANLVESPKLKPYGMVGIGFLTTSQDNSRGHRTSSTDFLIPVGGGFEYWVTDRLAWGGNVTFNVSQDIFFSLFFGVRTRF